MNYKKHCDLCEHQLLSLKDGNLCGLTKDKPDFNIVCSKIEFNKNLILKLEDIIVEYEGLKKLNNSKRSAFMYSIFFGLIIIIFGIIIWRVFLNKGYITSLTLIIIGLGFYSIKKAQSDFKSFKNNHKRTQQDKIEIDTILKLYNKKYQYKIIFGKEIHGTHEVNVKVSVI